MTPIEMLKSEDIEMVELGCNLLLNEMSIINIEDLLKVTKFAVKSFDRQYISLEEKGGLFAQMKQGNFHKIKNLKKSDYEKIMNEIYGTRGND